MFIVAKMICQRIVNNILLTCSPRRNMVYNIKQDSTYGKVVGAIRDGKWKFIRESASETEFRDILYDIEEDFMETTDLSEVHPDITLYMTGLFKELASSMAPGDDPEPIEGHVDVDENGYIKSDWCDV